MYDLINFNGTVIQDTHLERIAYNRAFLYGDGIFETMRIINGDIPLWNYHWSRLVKSAAFLRFPPHEWLQDKELAKAAILETAAPHQQASAKIIFFRTGPGKYAPKMARLQYMITSKAFNTTLPLWNEQGLHVGFSEQSMVPKGAPYGFIKKTAALPYVIADAEKEASGMDELCILNTDGDIAEGIYHNVFILNEKGEWLTPPLDSGCVAGVLRLFLIDHLKASGKVVHECTINRDTLMSAQEVIFTNAVRFIQPVSRILDKKFAIKHSLSIFEEICQHMIQKSQK